jgi:hypothetical protein
MIKNIVDVILSLFNKIKKKGDKTIYIVTNNYNKTDNININITHFHL